MGLDRAEQTIMDMYARNPLFVVFVGILLLSFIVDLTLCVATRLDFFEYSLDRDYPVGPFMDHFNSMMYSMDDAYSGTANIYPPLITLFYSILAHWSLPYTTITGSRPLSFDFRDSQVDMIGMVIIFILSISILRWYTNRVCKKQLEPYQISTVFFLVLVSTPMVYAIARGNSIIACVALVALFLLGYQSENKLIRYLSYIALAMSVGFKIVTVFFGFLILKQKKWDDFIVALLLTVILFFIPFIFTGGSITDLISNILHHSVESPERTLRTITTYIIWLDVILPTAIVNAITYATILITICLVGLVILLDKKLEYWKQLFLICGITTVGIGLGIRYNYLIMLLPLAYFLISEKEWNSTNILFVVIFILIFVFAPSMEFTRSFSTIIGMAWILGSSLKRCFGDHQKRDSTLNPDNEQQDSVHL